MLLSSFAKATVTLVPKSSKTFQDKELKDRLHEHRHRNP